MENLQAVFAKKHEFEYQDKSTVLASLDNLSYQYSNAWNRKEPFSNRLVEQKQKTFE